MSDIIDNVCEWVRHKAHNSDDYTESGAPIIEAWEQAGVPVKDAGATSIDDMLDAFSRCHFDVYQWAISFPIRKGDILLTPSRHVAQYIGNGRIVHVKKHGIDGLLERIGIQEANYYIPTYKWSYVLRYIG